MNELVVFSHVRWNFVCRRPQQILSRLARRWRVLFIEEPQYVAGDARAELYAPQTGVTVMTPHTPLTAPGFHDAQIPLLQKLVGSALARERFGDYVIRAGHVRPTTAGNTFHDDLAPDLRS